MECMCTTDFNSYLLPLIEDGEREAKCVATAWKVFGGNEDAEAVEVCELFSTQKCGQISRPCHFGRRCRLKPWTFSWPFTWRTAASTRLDGMPSQTHASPCRGMRRAQLRTR